MPPIANLTEVATSALGLGHGLPQPVDVCGGIAYVRSGVSLAHAPAAVCIGTFDGVHKGHRDLIESTKADARARGCLSVAVTFDPAPAEVLGIAAPSSRLLEPDDRFRLLLACGLDAVIVLRFDQALSQLDYVQFLDSMLCSILDPASLHVGENFRFGAQGRGDLRAIGAWGHRRGVGVCGQRLCAFREGIASSTLIRSLLRSGKTTAAADVLGRAHFVRGTVVRGRGEGTAFGFPTANLRAPQTTCMPREGVYAGLFVVDDWAWPAAVNVGAPPSFARASDPAFLEANLIGFSGNIYDKEAAVVFLDRLRDSRVFDSVEELEGVVLSNIEWVRTNIGGSGVEVRV